VVYTATDAKGNRATCRFTITVRQQTVNPCDTDTTPPSFQNCPQNMTVTTTSDRARVTWTAPTATDNCPPTPSVSASHQSGWDYLLGTTTVVYTATDAKGNRATCSFRITVQQQIVNPCDTDTTPPSFQNCPQNISLTTTGTTAVANWQPPTATDNCTANPSVSATHQNGGVFNLGITTVLYTARDAKGNTATCRFTVMVSQQIQNPCVNDVTPPVWVNCPRDTTIRTNSSRVNVFWTTPRATDNCRVETVSNNFSSGSSFSVGTTTVNYTASDPRGNRATCSFKVNIVRSSRADLGLVAEAKTPVYTDWSNNEWVITASNSGTEKLSSIRIQARFPDKVVNGGEAKASLGDWFEICANNTPCYEWRIANLAVGEKAVLTVPIFIKDAITPINLIAKLLSSTPSDGNSPNNTASLMLNPVQPVSNQWAEKTPLSAAIPTSLLDVLPNPTEGDVSVRLESYDARAVGFEFYNLLGQLVHQEIRQVEKGLNTLAFDMHGFRNGVYYLKTTIQNSRARSLKIIKL
jgi:hypothetical protein